MIQLGRETEKGRAERAVVVWSPQKNANVEDAALVRAAFGAHRTSRPMQRIVISLAIGLRVDARDRILLSLPPLCSDPSYRVPS